ncbi:hypothetical protein [Salinigranum sp.]|uniref:hypothetical protein n=1 Tax=Salinigranum sp. TaxID=1966351 RepID=UPI0035667270
MTHRRAAADTSVPSGAHPDGDTDHDDGDDGDRDAAGELDSGDLRRLLATRAGAVAAAERERALRAFDGDTTARRALSTMAVRIAVQAVEPAVAAAEAGDRTEAAVAELFVSE